MKKILFSTIALVAAFAANAEYLEVEHYAECALGEEITAALSAAGLSASQVTELKVVCPVEDKDRGADLYWATKYNDGEYEDCGRIRTMLPQLEKLDVSEAFFRYNETGEPLGAGFFMTGMKKLVEVWLPEGLNALGGESFRNCPALKTVHFPESMHSFGKRAFAGCTSLQMAELPETLTTLSDEVFYCNENSNGGKTPLANIKFTKLPAGLRSIGELALQETKCTISELPAELKTIGKAAFRGTPVTISYLPESVESVGEDAFIMCTGIKDFELTGIFATKVPDRVFYINDAIARNFTCRGTAPAVTAAGTGAQGQYSGSFGAAAVESKCTFYCLYDYKDSYNKAPWKQNLKYLTTPVTVSVPANVTLEHEHHGVIEGSTDIYEGSHEWTITPAKGYFITSIRYEESTPAKMENFRTDGDEDEVETEEPEADPAELYAVDPSLDNDALGTLTGQAQKVTVPVTTRPGTLKVATQLWIETGVEAVAAAPAFTRHGNIITVSEGTATVYDLTGKAIVTAAEIDLSTLSTGVYILRAGASAMKLAI